MRDNDVWRGHGSTNAHAPTANHRPGDHQSLRVVLLARRMSCVAVQALPAPAFGPRARVVSVLAKRNKARSPRDNPKATRHADGAVGGQRQLRLSAAVSRRRRLPPFLPDGPSQPAAARLLSGRAAAGAVAVSRLAWHSQCSHPNQPPCTWALSGLEGTLAGRAPLLHHTRHSFWLTSRSRRATRSASSNGRNCSFLALLDRSPVPSQWLHPCHPAVLADCVWVRGHVGRPHPFLAPLSPLEPIGQVEGTCHGHGLAKRQEPFGARLSVAGAEPTATLLPPSVFVDFVWG